MDAAHTSPEHLSPSLNGDDSKAAPAYEMKFLVDEEAARAVDAWARARLKRDPHCDPDLAGAYRTTSLYFDTPALDVYHRTPSYARRKYRIRLYGGSPRAFLECKTRAGDRVSKRRSDIAATDVALLAAPVNGDWPGHWFQQSLADGRLTPACLISYLRTAYCGACSEGPLRLTLDRAVHAELTGDWAAAPLAAGTPLLTDRVVLELKFRSALPQPFKELVAELQLSPCPASKYRLSRQACGVSKTGEAGDA